jgi:hypothetical protein
MYYLCIKVCIRVCIKECTPLTLAESSYVLTVVVNIIGAAEHAMKTI